MEASGCNSELGFLGHNDCNDDLSNNGVHCYPGNLETCDNYDNNCSGQADEGCDDDSDNYCDSAMLFYNFPVAVCPNSNLTNGQQGNDCDDANINVNPGVSEDCFNGADDDCDGDVDCIDNDCISDPACISCIPDSCNGICPGGCTSIEDPDCGTSGCCGDNIINPGEICDTSDLQGKDCTSFGYSGGILGCRWDCLNWDPNSCTGAPATCGNNICDTPGETCANCPTECCYCGNGTCDSVIEEDIDSCPDDCLVTCIEDWSCDPWSECVNGIQTTTCTDNNSCGTIDNKPAEIQSCPFITITDPIDGFQAAQNGPFINLMANLLNGVGSYNYQWTIDGVPFGNNGLFQNLNPATLNIGVHTVLVRAMEIGMPTDSIAIEILAPGSLIAQIQMWQTEFARDPINLANFNVQVNGGTAPYTFSWQSDIEGQFSTEQWPNIDVSSWALGTHSITVTVTDSLSLVATDNIDITISDMFIDNMMQPMEWETHPYGENMWFSAMVQGGTFPYIYSWSSNIDGNIGSTDFFEKDNLSEGFHTITLTVTDSSAIPIQISKEVHITITSPPSLITSVTSPLDVSSYAQGDNISFQAAVNGGVWPYVYSWVSDLDGQINTNKDFDMNSLSVGNHQITFTTTDNAGQIVDKVVNITITNPNPLVVNITFPLNAENFYSGDSLISFVSDVSGGVGPYAYSWDSNLDGFLSDKDSFYSSNLSAGSQVVTLTVTDQNSITQSAVVNFIVNPALNFANTKDLSKYSAKETFLISHENWQDVLSLVPISIWESNKYPMLVYHEEVLNIDIDSAIHFMQLYEPDHLTTVNTMDPKVNPLLVGAQPTGAELNVGSISNINSADYFSYWTNINSVVVVDYDNYKEGLMATVFASYKNAPIIFVNDTNLNTYQGLLNGKVVYTVGSLEASTQNYINNNALANVKYSLKELQAWYINETNTNKVIYVNEQDLNNDYVQGGPEPDFYSTEKGGVIYTLLNRLSMAAPYLASAKEEVIIFPESQNAQDVSDLFDLIPADNYITTMASHDMISGKVNGRIAGISSADTFSYSARSIFYNELFDKIYPGSIYNKFYIGADLSCDPILAVKTMDNINFLDYYFNKADYSHDDLKGIQFNVYESHGYYSGWACDVFNEGWMYMNDIPWLDLSWGSAGSCSTGQFKGAISFSYNWLRRGGMAYYGANKIIGLGDIYYGTRRPFEEWRADENISLRDLAHNIGGPYDMYGDPSLSLIYRGGPDQLPEASLFLSETEFGGQKEITVSSGQTVYFLISGLGHGRSLDLWEVDYEGDGSYDYNNSSSDTITYVYNTPGIYKPRLRITNDIGGQSITFAIINVQ